MTLERLGVTLGLTSLGYLAYRGYAWWVTRRRVHAGLGLDEYHPGRPAILYFTDPGCAPCLAVQDPALQELAARVGDRLQIIKVQALERTDLTDAWGVLSLPTTFIIDSHGQPRGVIHGVARATRLLDQLVSIGEFSTEASTSPKAAAGN